MNCKDTKKLTAAFLDGELTDKEQALFGEHLAACQGCREEMEALAATRENLRQTLKLTAARYSPSPDAWQRLRQQITGEEQPEAATPKRTGMGRLIPRRLNWKTGTIGILALALVVSLAVTIPPLFGQDDKALAAEIALSNPGVQAAFGGEEPLDVTVTGIIDDEGTMRVIMRVEPGMWVVADVDMGNQEVITVKVQELPGITEQEVIDIAKTDPRVQELFDKGYHIEDLEFVEVYPAIVDVWVEEYHYWTGVKPEDLIGFTAGFSLQLGDTYSPSNPRYTVVVNVTTGKVVWVAEPGQGPDGTTITTVITP